MDLASAPPAPAGPVPERAGISPNGVSFQVDARARFLSELDEKIRPLNADEDIFSTTAAALGDYLKASRCFFSELDGDAGMAKVHRDFHPDAPSVQGAHRLADFGREEDWEAFRAGRVQAVEDTATDPRTADFFEDGFRPLHIRAALSVPCMSGGEWAATLSVCAAAPRAWTAEEIRLVETVVAHTWLPVENARLIARLRQELAERAEAQSALRASEERYRSLVQATTSLVWTADGRGRFVTPQRSWTNFTGQKWREHRGLGWFKMIHPEDRESLGRQWQLAVKNRSIFAGEGRIWSAAGGGYRCFVARAAPVLRRNGAVKEWIGTVTDIHAQKQTEAALRVSEERSHRLHEANIIGVCSGDQECIREANDIFLHMLGFAREELAAGCLRWRDITPAEWRECDEEKFRDLLSRGIVPPFEKEYFARDGRRVPVLLGVALVTREPVSWIAFALDLTEMKRVHQELRAAKEAAEAANSAKDQFLAMLSHELRTPLMPVLMSVSAFAEDPALTRELREELALLRRSIELEARLIDDLLDLTRITKGKLLLECDTLDVHAVLRDVANLLRGDAAAKQIAVVLELSSPRSHVHGDSARLEQIFCNLVTNALKFTPQGGHLRIASRLAPDAENVIELRFADDGIGIEPEMLAEIFNAFEQGGDSTTRRFGGLGLGLAISKALVEMHGGAISAASAGAGHGAEFTLRLPLVSAAAVTPPAAQPAGDMRPLRILLVEDHEATAFVMARLLRRRGHNVRTVGCVREAEENPALGEIDLVISDIGLPDGSGFDLMRTLQARYGLRGIALSGYGTELDVRKSLESGFALHLTKPIDAQKLEDAIYRVCAVES